MPSPLLLLPAVGAAGAGDADFFLLVFLLLFFSAVFLEMPTIPDDELPPSAAVMKLQHARMMAHFFFAVDFAGFLVLCLPLLPFLEADEVVRMTIYVSR